MLQVSTRARLFGIVVVLLLGSVASGDIPFDKFASNEPLDGEVFVLVNTNSGRCLTVKDGSKDAGARIVQGVFATEAGSAEKWKAVKIGDAYKLVNLKSGKVLAVPEGSKEKGTEIIQWDERDDGDQKEQRWEFVKTGKHYTLKSQCSGLLLAVSEGGKEEKHPVIQWEPTKAAEQLWFVQWVPGAGKK
jgi:hypothetical protein